MIKKSEEYHFFVYLIYLYVVVFTADVILSPY